VDVALKGDLRRRLHNQIMSFNPCFGGCRSERHHLNRLSTYQHRVSILVLVDVALKGEDAIRTVESKYCFNPCFGGCRSESWAVSFTLITLMISFNPCFGGCRSESHEERQEAPSYSYVSILVLVDVALKEFNILFNHCSCNQFQSLFWWMSL